MTIAVADRAATAGQYSAPSAVTPVSLRPLGQANQRLENKYGDEVERIFRSMRSAEFRMESPRSVSTRNPIVCECMRLERSALINAMEAGCRTVQALSMHRGGDDMRRLLATARRAYRRNVMANGVLPRSDRSRAAGEIVSFRGAVLSRPRSDPTGATPYCTGDYRRC
jgi:hypothetical protein